VDFHSQLSLRVLWRRRSSSNLRFLPRLSIAQLASFKADFYMVKRFPYSCILSFGWFPGVWIRYCYCSCLERGPTLRTKHNCTVLIENSEYAFGDYNVKQWRTEGGGFGVQALLRNSVGPPKSCQTQPDCENC